MPYYHVGLAALGLDRTESDRLAALPPPERYDTLLERGWLGRYFDALQASVTERAIVCVGAAATASDLRFASMRPRRPPTGSRWGCCAVSSSPDAPVLLWLREPGGGPGAAAPLSGTPALRALALGLDAVRGRLRRARRRGCVERVRR